MKYSIETGALARFVVLATALTVVAATLTPAFAQSLKIALTEVRLEPATPSPTAHDQFGNVTALSANGQTLAIGATTTDQGAISEDGAVLIFDRVQDKWVQTARLFPSDGTDDEQSAFNVAISEDGNTVVSAPLLHDGVFRSQGAIYVFHRVNGTWTQQAELVSPTPSINATFGTFGVGISGDTIAAGDFTFNDIGNVLGDVDVFTRVNGVWQISFTRVNGVWQISTTIQLPDDPDFSPVSIALSGTTLVVGSGFNIVTPGGTAHVFSLMNGKWVLQSKLVPSDATFGSNFGSIVAVDGNLVVVGAPFGPGASAFSGAAYVFGKQDNGGWSQQAKLTAADGVSFDQFGLGVAVNGGTVGIGGSNHTTSAGFGAGIVYLYRFNDGKWTQFAELTGSDVAAGAGFGSSVALKNGTLAVGAPGQHPQPDHNPFYPEGEAYVYGIN
jgi:hypothetical protein